MKELFVRELREMLGLEARLADDVLPALRQRAHAVDLRQALDRHLLETEAHVENLRTVLGHADAPARPLDAGAPALPEETDDFAVLAYVLETEALEVGSYSFLVHAARALGMDGDAVRLLRTNMEQDAYALEQAEYTLVKLLAEKVESR